MSIETLTRKRVSILHRYFSYVCDQTHPFQAQDLMALRARFAVNAGVQKVPDSHKWVLKITSLYENLSPVNTYSARRGMRDTVNSLYHDNGGMFRGENPDNCRLRLSRL